MLPGAEVALASLAARRQVAQPHVATPRDELPVLAGTYVTEMTAQRSPPPLPQSPTIAESMSTCYICEDEGGELWTVCLCNGRLLHLECQRQMMMKTRAHRLECAVCLERYNNVKVVTVKRKMSREGKRLTLYVIGVLGVVGIAVYEMFMWVIYDNTAYLVVALLFALAAIAFMGVGCYLFWRTNLLIEQKVVSIGRPHSNFCASRRPGGPPCPSLALLERVGGARPPASPPAAGPPSPAPDPFPEAVAYSSRRGIRRVLTVLLSSVSPTRTPQPSPQLQQRSSTSSRSSSAVDPFPNRASPSPA